MQTAPWVSVCRSKIAVCFGFYLKFDLQREWLVHYVDARLLEVAHGRWQNRAAASEQIPLQLVIGQRDRCVLSCC